MATLHAAERVRVGCGSEHGAVAHELGKISVDDAVAMLDGIVAREDVLGVVVAKWQVNGVKFEMLLKNTPLTREFAPRRPPETLKLRVSAQKFKAFSHIEGYRERERQMRVEPRQVRRRHDEARQVHSRLLIDQQAAVAERGKGVLKRPGASEAGICYNI